MFNYRLIYGLFWGFVPISSLLAHLLALYLEGLTCLFVVVGIGSGALLIKVMTQVWKISEKYVYCHV